MLLALVVGLPLLRLRGHFLALATLGLGIIVSVVVRELEVTGGTSGIFGIPKPDFNGRVYDSRPRSTSGCSSPFVVIGLLLAHTLVRSRSGRALSAVNDSEVAAECLGVDTFALRLRRLRPRCGVCRPGRRVLRPLARGGEPRGRRLRAERRRCSSWSSSAASAPSGARITGAIAVEAIDEGSRTIIPQLIPGASGEVQLIGFGVVLVLLIILLPGGLAQLWNRLTHRTGSPATAGALAGSDVEPDVQLSTASPSAVHEARPPRSRGAGGR